MAAWLALLLTQTVLMNNRRVTLHTSLAPVVVHDLLRVGRVHWAYLLGGGLFELRRFDTDSLQLRATRATGIGLLVIGVEALSEPIEL
jgi:hypothetical protein